MKVLVTCWRCLGHGYPPATLTGFDKTDPEMCSICSGTGLLAEEKPPPPIRMFWVCAQCRTRNRAVEKFCIRCQAPKE